MNIIALRITVPRTRRTTSGSGASAPRTSTAPSSCWMRRISQPPTSPPSRVVQIGHGQFDAIWLSGDELEQDHNQTKALQVLGWAPKSQRYLNP